MRHFAETMTKPTGTGTIYTNHACRERANQLVLAGRAPIRHHTLQQRLLESTFENLRSSLGGLEPPTTSTGEGGSDSSHRESDCPAPPSNTTTTTSQPPYQGPSSTITTTSSPEDGGSSRPSGRGAKGAIGKASAAIPKGPRSSTTVGSACDSSARGNAKATRCTSKRPPKAWQAASSQQELDHLLQVGWPWETAFRATQAWPSDDVIVSTALAPLHDDRPAGTNATKVPGPTPSTGHEGTSRQASPTAGANTNLPHVGSTAEHQVKGGKRAESGLWDLVAGSLASHLHLVEEGSTPKLSRRSNPQPT